MPGTFATTSTLSKPEGVCGLAIIVSFLVVCYVSRLVYNVYFHPLSKFPGPRLAGASRWYEAYFDNLVGCGGQYMYEIDRIHRDYGSLAFLPVLSNTGPCLVLFLSLGSLTA